VADEPIALEPLDPEPVDPNPSIPNYCHASSPHSPSASPRPQLCRVDLVLPSLAILAFIAIGLLIASRVGWLHLMPLRRKLRNRFQQRQFRRARRTRRGRSRRSPSGKSPFVGNKVGKNIPAVRANSRRPAAGELVVYEKGKVIFRMKSDTTTTRERTTNPARCRSRFHQKSRRFDRAAASTTAVPPPSSPQPRAPPPHRLDLTAEAADRLLNRTSPAIPGSQSRPPRRRRGPRSPGGRRRLRLQHPRP